MGRSSANASRSSPVTEIQVSAGHGNSRELVGRLQTGLASCLTEAVALLGKVHSQLGVLVSNAYLNELTRNQAVRLSALNDIARALSGTHDAEGVAAALYSTLTPLLPVDALEMVVREGRSVDRL